MTYKDVTFCQAWKECKKGEGCSLAFTEQVIIDADRVFGGKGKGLVAITEKRECFECK